MPKAPYFFIPFWLKVHVISLNFIAFIIIIETEASLLALAKSIEYCYILRIQDMDSKVGAFSSKWQISELCKSFRDLQTRKTSIRYIHHLKLLVSKRRRSLRDTLWLVHLHSAPEYI